MFVQRKVNDATLVGGHGFQGDGLLGACHVIGDALRELTERFCASLLVSAYVDYQVDPVLDFATHDQPGNILKCVKCLALSTN
jgi:hypothetical protein